MVATRAQRRSAAGSRTPLQHAGILQRVLDYVVEVSSLWRDVYIRVASREQVVAPYKTTTITFDPQMTMFAAVFASPSRVRYAQTLERSCTRAQYEHAAGMYADIATLEAAHELGMSYTYGAMEARSNELAVVQFLRDQGCPWGECVYCIAAARGHAAICAYLHVARCTWSDIICNEAAINGHSSTLRLLHELGCPWCVDSIYLSAAHGGGIDAMVYVQQQGIVFTAAILTDMLNTAGTYRQLAAAKWLRQQGAEWPVVLALQRSTWLGGMLAWAGDTLEWARAEGCMLPVA
jgi:hypothetical protein